MTTLEIIDVYNILKKENEDAYKENGVDMRNWHERSLTLPKTISRFDEPLYLKYMESSKRLNKSAQAFRAFEKKEWT